MKIIRIGYVLISIIICIIWYRWIYEWNELERLDIENKQIDISRQEIHKAYIHLIEFSLSGETILEWDDEDLDHYHAQRMAMDSLLCCFKNTYSAERIDSVRYLLEDKERQMFQIVRLIDKQQSISKKIASQVPLIVQTSVQEQPKKQKRKGFLGIFGKKEDAKPTTSTTVRDSRYALKR
jgi:two-component system sensor histidine kinase EvgS